MLRTMNAALAVGLLTWFSGCGSVTATGPRDPGCTIYGEARAKRPDDAAFLRSDAEVVAWVGETDAAMTGGCR